MEILRFHLKNMNTLEFLKPNYQEHIHIKIDEVAVLRTERRSTKPQIIFNRPDTD